METIGELRLFFVDLIFFGEKEDPSVFLSFSALASYD
jgi:hypothetical protein